MLTINLSASNFIKIGVEMTNSVCTLLVDSGADISIFKSDKILVNHKINNNVKTIITGITEGEIETLAVTETILNFGNGVRVNHSFHVVNANFPILTDGILGRDFLSLFRCNIDYESWLLNFNINNTPVSVPIQDTVNENYIIPRRCEVIRKIKDLNITEDMVLFSQEVKPGLFCGNAIISPNCQYVKFMNITLQPINVSNVDVKLMMEPLTNYQILNFRKSKKPDTTQMRNKEILEQVDLTNVPDFAKDDLKKLITNYSDIFSLPDEPVTVNNFYEQTINTSDPVPTYIPNYKTIHSQSDEIQAQVNKMLKDNIIEPSVSSYNSPILLVPKKSTDDKKKCRMFTRLRPPNGRQERLLERHVRRGNLHAPCTWLWNGE